MTDQLPLGLRLRDTSVFASYRGARNQPLVDTLQCLRAGGSPTCVYLHGGTGAGKSHLLQAICTAAGQRGESAAYLPLGLLSRMGPEVLSGCGERAFACVDDVNLIAGERSWQRALFTLHQQLDEHRGRLIVASSAPPAALRIELADLASRLSGGLVLTLAQLDESEQVAALQLRAKLRGFELPDETASYLLRRLPRDMHSLYAFLDELDVASLAAQRHLTVPFVKSVLGKKAPGRGPQAGGGARTPG